jgi:glycosyltransferase involved in cell wall biosynthesis
MDKVSVIIPTYNRSYSLISTVKSILAQTYPVTEIFVCDDGSTDNSKDVVEAFTDERIHWIDCGRNGRPAIPRNIGISKASGDWIAFLDSDDTWESNKIEKQIAAAKRNNCLAISSNAIRVLPEQLEKNESYFSFNSRILTFEDLLQCNNIICSSALVHKSIIEKLPGFPESVEFTAIEDYSYWLKVATLTNWYYLQDTLVKYLDNPSESIRSVNTTEKLQQLTIYPEYLKWNRKRFLNEYKLVKTKYLKLKNKDSFFFKVVFLIKLFFMEGNNERVVK